jgi:hypothetical protein
VSRAVQVSVENLGILMKAAAAANTKPVLFLNGQEMKGMFGWKSIRGRWYFSFSGLLTIRMRGYQS